MVSTTMSHMQRTTTASHHRAPNHHATKQPIFELKQRVADNHGAISRMCWHVRTTTCTTTVRTVSINLVLKCHTTTAASTAPELTFADAILAVSGASCLNRPRHQNTICELPVVLSAIGRCDCQHSGSAATRRSATRYQMHRPRATQLDSRAPLPLPWPPLNSPSYFWPSDHRTAAHHLLNQTAAVGTQPHKCRGHPGSCHGYILISLQGCRQPGSAGSHTASALGASRLQSAIFRTSDFQTH